MNNITTRLFSIFISICLIFTLCLSQSISVYAADDSKSLRQYLSEFGDKAINAVAEWMCQVGVIIDSHDFNQWLDNYYVGKEYWNGNYVHVDDSNGTITFDKELTDLLKKLLKQYANEYQPYYYAWSSGFEEISYGTFGSQKNVRDTVYNVLKTAPSNTIKFGINFGMFNGVYKSYIYIGVFDNLRDIGFVHDNSGNSQLAYHYSYSTWANTLTDIYCVELTASDDAIVSWESFKDSALCVNQTYDGRSFYKDGPLKELVFCSETERSRISSGFKYNSFLGIVTPTRTTFRIFRESDDLFDYSLDKRGIYFTSDFWEYDPSDFTASLDDLNDSIGRMQDLIDMLLDRIGDNSSESEIEELLRQILEELKNGNGSGDTGGSSGGSDSSKDYSEFFKDILGYLKTMNSNIKDILDNLKSFKNYVIAKDIADIISDLFDDPETGSKDMVNGLYSSFGELAGMLTDKFPFCIPFDLYRLFGILAGLSETEAVTLDSYDTGPLQSIASSMNEYGIDSSNILVYADGGGHNRDPGSGESGNTYAPYFELPIVIERYGIDERIIVDMKPFQPISTLSRFLFTIVFCVGLIKFTIKFADILKGMFE